MGETAEETNLQSLCIRPKSIKLKQLHLQSATFLALYTFVKKAFMSAKTFVKINILLDSISIHVGINMNSDGHQTEGVGSYSHKKLLTIRFKLTHLHEV